MSIIFLIGEEHRKEDGRKLINNLMDLCHKKDVKVTFMFEGMLGGEWEIMDENLRKGLRPTNEVTGLLYDIFLSARDKRYGISHIEAPLKYTLEEIKKDYRCLRSVSQIHLCIDSKQITMDEALIRSQTDIDIIEKSMDADKIAACYEKGPVQKIREEYFIDHIKSERDKSDINIVLVGNNHLDYLKDKLQQNNFQVIAIDMARRSKEEDFLEGVKEILSAFPERANQSQVYKTNAKQTAPARLAPTVVFHSTTSTTQRLEVSNEKQEVAAKEDDNFALYYYVVGNRRY